MENSKPNLTLGQIWNMSFGFLGIQYGFGLQQANMSPIYRYLGADEAEIPGLWLAGPLTGLLLQPIIGAMSDRSWSPKWGRRKPYVFIGAIVGSIAMILMPNSKSVFMAACLMWLLDAGLNSSMEPFRAFVGDMLNPKQRPLGFSVQSFMVGFGQTLANLMPFILPIVGISMAITGDQTDLANGIPNSVRYPFYIGAAAILATVFWTMYTTQEYPPENDDYKKPHVFTAEQEKNITFWHRAITISGSFLAALFAFRLGYLSKLKEVVDGLKLSKLSEFAQSAGEKSGLLQKFVSENSGISLKSSSLEKLFAEMKDESLVKTITGELKSLENYTPSDAQSHEFLMFALKNGLIWGLGISIGLYLLLRLNVFKEILASLSEMPDVMRQLWWVKFFTWYGLPLMWQYLSLACAKYAFDAASPEANKAGFDAGREWGSLCFAVFSITCFLISIFMPRISKAIGSARKTHAIFLCIGAIGFFTTFTSNDKMIYLTAMSMVGLAWGSIMSMPYLMLANAVSKQSMGVYMGIFNGFICVPQFIGMLTVPLYYESLLGDDPRNALGLAGVCLLAAAASCFLVKEKKV